MERNDTEERIDLGPASTETLGNGSIPSDDVLGQALGLTED